jgi:peroxiredoxin
MTFFLLLIKKYPTMKKIFLITIATILFSCNDSVYNISGEIKGLADGTKVFLEKQENAIAVAVDTVKIENGKFDFKGETQEAEIHNIRFENTKGGFVLVVEKGDIKAVVNKDSISIAKISGTYNNDELNKYNNLISQIQKKMMDFQQKNMGIMQEASEKNDTVIVNKLRKDYSKFQDEFIVTNDKYIENSPKSFISVLLIEGMLGEVDVKFDKITKYFNALDSSLKETKHGKKIKTKLDALNSVAIGQKAPDFSAPNPDGKTISLHESLGKVTIVDFWASWCGPCRQESPNFVAIYNEFHSKGLNFIGVSLDKKDEKNKWTEAIAKDKLNWVHVSNLEFWDDPIAKKYGVEGIPSTFILDKNGIIVAKNLRGMELKAKVAELLLK